MPVPKRQQDETVPSGRPSIKLLTDDPSCPVLLKCGRSAVLSVQVFGHFKPSVRWFIGQRMVRDCPRYGLSTDGHELYALVIRQVTEELECGVLVTAFSDNGVSSKLIDIKTYRVLSRTSHSSHARTTGSIGSVRRRRQVRGQLMSYPVRGRYSLGSIGALGPCSTQGLTVKKAYSSTDAILEEGHVTPDFLDSSPLPDTGKVNRAIRIRSSVRAVEIRRLRKAFSWVENLVQELPTPPITPGVWEAGRPVYVSQDSLLTPSTPVLSPPTRHSVDDRSTSTAGSRSLTEAEDRENEVLWQMYGFKLGRERPLPGLEEQSEESLRDPHPPEKQKEMPENGRPSKKTNSQPNFFAGPLSTASLENLNLGVKTRSALELELMTQGSKPRGNKKQRPDPRYCYLRTNARIVCCETPVITDKSNDSEIKCSLPQALHTVPFELKPVTESNQLILSKSSEGISYPKYGSSDVKTYSRTQGPQIVDTNKRGSADGLVKEVASDHWNDTHRGNQVHVEQPRRAIAKSCDDFYVGQPSHDSDDEQEKAKQQQQQRQKQHSASYKRKAYRATVNLRKKKVGSSGESERITKFILVDIDFDNRSVRPADSEGRLGRDRNPFEAGWDSVERGRSKGRGEVHEDERRSVTRSRSADSSISYLYEKMYRNEQLKNGKNNTEVLLDTKHIY